MGYGPVCAKNYRLPWGENTRQIPDELSQPDSYEGEEDEDADAAYAIWIEQQNELANPH